MLRFHDSRILLTGVGRPGQVGEAVARAFATEGAHLLLLARARDEADSQAEELRATGARVDAFGADLADAAQLARVADEVRAATGGGLDALVHMAGGFGVSGRVGESDPETWTRIMTMNLTTAYLTTRAMLPLVRERRGAIVYFASSAVLPGEKVAETSAYVAAKSGVVALARSVAGEEKASGVRANALAPTAIRTATNLASMGDGVRYVEREEVAATVLFLCSEGGRAVNGQVVRLG